MPQLHACYVIDELYHLLAEFGDENLLLKEKVHGLLHALGHFELDLVFAPNNLPTSDSLVCVADKIISRGLPTKASIFLSETLLKHFSYFNNLRRTEKIGAIYFEHDVIPQPFIGALFNALHVIDPRIRLQTSMVSKTWEDHGSEYESKFLSAILPSLGLEYLVQLLETQKDFEGILRFGDNEEESISKYLQGSVDVFLNQKVDFSLSFPYPLGKKIQTPDAASTPGFKGVVIEIDGRQHDQGAQLQADRKRDEAVINAGWHPTQRLKTRNFSDPVDSLAGILSLKILDYFKRTESNFNQPLYNTESGLAALQLMLAPVAVARIQKTILYCLFNGLLDLNDKEWNLVFIERDVPCAWLGIEDFKQLMGNLLILEGKGRVLPEINLTIRCTEEFKNATLHTLDENTVVKVLDEKENFSNAQIVFDIAVLSRKGYFPAKIGDQDKIPYLFIRSAYSPHENRRFTSAAPIKYCPLLEIPDEAESEVYNVKQIRALEYFLQNIFRKAHFREGQLPILNRGIQYKSVLGLLPTGGGKSLTYQLAALLQPGTTLVIDPIKSLMQDQYDNLIKSKIDAVSFINSTVKSAVARDIRMSQLSSGELLFCFISPERLQIPSFRERLADMHHLQQQFFNFCIIDEAHCVSEWGHDFRTSYLRLGDNIRQHCQTFTGEVIPLYGLTATASFDVLADVERELNLESEAVVRSETTERPELTFVVRDVDTTDIPTDEYNPVGAQKHHLIQEVIKYDIPSLFNETPDFYQPDEKGKYKNSGLIFCPYKKATTREGVMSVYNLLNRFTDPALKPGYFMGGDDMEDSNGVAAASALNQTQFVENKLSVLAATKAFGMGIDKPNIRYTIHFNYPNSIEAFYQEAGRAGRDRDQAVNYVFYHRKKTLANGAEYDPDKDLLLSFHNNSFKGEKKEKTVLYELLTKITYPYKDSNSSIASYLRQELEIETQPFIYRGNRSNRIQDPFVLIVSGEGDNSYGWVNFQNPANITIDPTRTRGSIHADQAQIVLSTVKEFILQNCPDLSSREAIEKWLSMRSPVSAEDGIEVLLKKAKKIGEPLPPIQICFRGSALNDIVELLSLHNPGKEIGERLILNAYGFCHSEEEFLKNILKEYRKQTGDFEPLNIPDKALKTLGNQFWKIRESADTFKAIHRLITIGVIDDYEVDYGKELLIVYLTKKKDDHYLDSLFEYISRYFSNIRATKKVKTEVPLRAGESTLQKCLGYLVEFTYKQIADKRRKAIDSMVEACEEGWAKGSEDMKQFIHLYFNSLYARQEYLPTDTEDGKLGNFEIIFTYLGYMKESPISGLVTEIDNVKHLRGACIRMLGSNPDNCALLYLNAFCIFFLELNKPFQRPNQRMLSDGIDSLVKGYYNFLEHEDMPEELLQINTEKFIKVCSEFNKTLATYIKEEVIPVLELRRHLQWLKYFNRRMNDKRETIKSPEYEPEFAERIA